MIKNKLKFSSKLILFTLASVIILHLLITIGLQVTNYEERQAGYENRIIEQILNTLHVMRVSPDKDATIIAKVSELDELKVTITLKPTWHHQVNSLNYWKVSELLRKDFNVEHISVPLDDNRWANFQYKLEPSPGIVQLGIILFDIVIAGILLFCAWYIERFTGPLKKLKQMAERLGIELAAEPVLEYGPAIVKETADAMNKMQSRIMQLLQDKEQMLAAISHDLRTPLTRLKLRAQFITDKTQLADTLSDIDEMEQMIQQVLTYSHDSSQQEKSIQFDLIALLQTLCDEHSDMGASIQLTCSETRWPFLGSPLAMKRALNNLLVNATKYGQQILVSFGTNSDDIIIKITDDGPGIPEHYLKQVFSPFFRVDASRSTKTGGHGLGLAIAHKIIAEHGGKIVLTNAHPKGLTATITWPNVKMPRV